MNDHYTMDMFTPHKLARRRDPDTSKQAAQRVRDFGSTHHGIIVAALKDRAGTPYEIAARAGLRDAAVFRRMNELQRMGYAVTTGEERDGCRVWAWTGKEPA